MPMALAVVSLVSTAASAVVQHNAARSQAKVAEQTSQYNAKLQENQAIQADMEAREQIRRDRVLGKKFLSTQRAETAASGVVATTGSPLELLGETAGLLELQAQDTARAAEARRRLGFASAAMTRADGKNIAAGYKAQATGSILSGIGKLAGDAYGFKRDGVFGGG